MRVAIVTESFLPDVNGVVNSVLRITEHLEDHGHEVLIIAPGDGPFWYRRTPVLRVPAVDLPLYRGLPVGLPSARTELALRAFCPDVVHLASPIALGAHGASVAARLGIPAVAVYQTDVAGFARRYGLSLAGPVIWAYLRCIHNGVARTLAPTPTAAFDLRAHGIERVALWPRGVDATAFAPRWRDLELRRSLAPEGDVIVGYVGRLAREKQVDRLAALDEMDGVQVVIVGDGPDRTRLRSVLPNARFVGFQGGAALSRHVASLDVFVHTGTEETFCQAAQEAMAAGVPVVVPAAGGVRDLVSHDRTGLLWRTDQPGSLRAGVTRLVADADLRQRLGTAARAAVAERTWTAVSSALVEHHRAVARASTAGTATTALRPVELARPRRVGGPRRRGARHDALLTRRRRPAA